MLALVRPAILHIATHFNFLADAHAAADGRRRGRGGPLSKPTSSPDLHAIALTSANYWPHFLPSIRPRRRWMMAGWCRVSLPGRSAGYAACGVGGL